jgi:hypothetical protein
LFDDSIVHSSTILDSSADNDSTLYSQTARTSKPVRLVGRLRITHGSDVWDTAPTELSIWHPGMKKTGDIVQRVRAASGLLQTLDVTAGVVVSLNSDSFNLEEGKEATAIAATITPKVSINTLRVGMQINTGSVAANSIVAGLFQDSGTSALVVQANYHDGSNTVGHQNINYEAAAGGTSAIEFTCRVGGSVAGIIYVNGISTGVVYDGACNSYMLVEEIQE